jgi:hypothetical protein
VASRAPALDPFALPATTDSRFLLLIATVIGATTYAYGRLALQVPALRQAFVDAALNCGPAANELNDAVVAALQGGAGGSVGPSAFALCTADVQIASALWSLSGLPLLGLLTLAIYWFAPHWIRRRRNLVPLDPEDAAEILDALRDLAAESGLQPAPTFIARPGTASTGALAFGRPAERFVALDAGLVTLFYTQRARFTAVVRHELAHIRNADVDKAYLTVAAALAFGVVGLVPLFAVLALQPPDELLGIGAIALGLAVLVWVSAAGVLRAREYYADLRAATWADSNAALVELFGAAPEPSVPLWRRPLRLHPLPSARQAILGDAVPLFRVEPLEALGVGLAVAVLLPRIMSITAGLASRSNQSLVGPLVAAVCLAPLLVGILGVAIWRAALARRHARPAPLHGARVAFGLAAGVGLGALVVSFDAYTELLLDASGFVILKLLWGVLVGAVLWPCLSWQSAAAEAALAEAADGVRSARQAMFVGLAAMLLVLVATSTVLFFTLAGGGAFSSGAMSAIVVPVVFATGVFLTVTNLPLLAGAALVVVWAYPLLAARAGVPLRVLLAGVVGGAVFVIADLVFDRQFHELPSEVRATDDAKLNLLYTAVLTSLLIQAVVAGVVAWTARDRKLPLAQFAAFVVGALALAAFTLIHADGVDLPYLVSMYVQIVAAGGLVALVSGGLAAAVTSRASAHLDPRLIRV